MASRCACSTTRSARCSASPAATGASSAKAGVHVAPVSALYWLHTVSYRNHRKIAVIDGQVGYTGGMNIGQEHIDGGPTLRPLAGHAGAPRRGGGGGVAGGVPRRLVQRDGRGPLRGGPVSVAWNGVRLRAEDGDAGAGDGHVPVQILTSGPGLGVARHPPALLRHDHVGPAARAAAIALLHPRRDHRGGAQGGGAGRHRRSR